MYFNVNFNVLFKLIKVHLLVSELYIYQNARCNDKSSRYSFQILTKLEFSQRIFEKFTNIGFHENPSSGRRNRRKDKIDEANIRILHFSESV